MALATYQTTVGNISVTSIVDGICQKGAFLGTGPRFGRLIISGLCVGANQIPHLLAFTPAQIRLRPGANGLWGETQVPDATNIYITVGAGGSTSGNVNFDEA